MEQFVEEVWKKRTEALQRLLKDRSDLDVTFDDDSPEPYIEMRPTINDRFELMDDTHAFMALTRWVDSETRRCTQEGAIFDTSFHAVSEGGEVFEFDPEVICKELASMQAQITTLTAFKKYTHDRLDAMGVPANPEPPKHALEGCRIGDRLDFIESRLVAKKSAEKSVEKSAEKSAEKGTEPDRSSIGPSVEGRALIRQWEKARQYVETCRERLNDANQESERQRLLLSRWLLPAKCTLGERLVMWVGDGLLEVEATACASDGRWVGAVHWRQKPSPRSELL